MKKIIHFDKKILTPNDITSTGREKPLRGFVVIGNEKGERRGENLVVLKGREFFAQMLSGTAVAGMNYLNYKLQYFGVGSGGAEDDSNGDPVVKKGPYANDTDLYEPVKISTANSSDGVKYIDNGYLKYITEDEGSIQILSEDHDITTENGTETVSAYTTIKYTMYLTEDEPPASSKPFEFNEAGLWAVEYDPNTGKPVVNDDGTAKKILVAHFTTSSKYIEENEGVKIEWYILV